MSLRYLLGPVTSSRASLWCADIAAGLCLPFGPEAAGLRASPSDDWETIQSRLPSGWRPDVVVLDLAYTTAPWKLWQAPLPVIALAPDWPWQWHFLREVLPFASLVLTDSLGVETIARAGLCPARRAHLFGLQGVFAPPPSDVSGPRDIDILFVGNLNGAVQRDRNPWLRRLALLGRRWRVKIAQGIRGDDYRQLLLRSRIVFNRSARGEWNLRVGEVCSCAALLFQERGNLEMADWEDRRHCVFYDDANLEILLERYLTRENERLLVALAGREKVLPRTFSACWRDAREAIAQELPSLLVRLPERPAFSPERQLLARVWQALGAADQGDPSLQGDLAAGPKSPALLSASAVLAARSGADLPASAAAFHTASVESPKDVVAAFNLVESLARCGQRDLAIKGAARLLGLLATTPAPVDLTGPLYPSDYSTLRVEWERAAWSNPDRPDLEAEEKAVLLRWGLHSRLIDLTGDKCHLHEAALARPDLPVSRTKLGCGLAGSGRHALALPHLRRSIQASPFDRPAARAYFQCLQDLGRTDEAESFRRDELALYLSAPDQIAPEPWFRLPTYASSPTPCGSNPSGQPPLRFGEPGCVSARRGWGCFGEGVFVWQGPIREQHSLGLVNRRLCLALLQRGHELSLIPTPGPAPQVPPDAEWRVLEPRLAAPLSRNEDAVVRHQWPPDWSPPEHGLWIVMQPWEYGAVPSDWVPPLTHLVDELWVPTAYVRDGFLQSGVPGDRVVVLPLGADEQLFHPEGDRLELPTSKRFKFLFVGGTIHRKGFDVLLDAFGQAFTDQDDVSLVVKDMGGDSFYRGQTAEQLLSAFRAKACAPEVAHLAAPLSDREMAALYRSCDCLVHAYRGEGFGLPIVEAMASALPVVVTAAGAALDFCDERNGWLIPAKMVPFPENKVGDLLTSGTPALAEPDPAALASILRSVVADPEEARRRGLAGRRRALERLTWNRAADWVEQRLRELHGRKPRRFEPPVVRLRGLEMKLHQPARDVWISAPLAKGQPYESFETELVLSQVKPGDVVVDVGANIGYYTLLLARAVGPMGKVLAFEPDPDNFALLKHNVERNDLSNVLLFDKALSDRTGKATLHKSANNQGDHRLAPPDSPREKVEVQTVRLDDAYPRDLPAPALVKLDVQGAEALALRGMRSLLKRRADLRVFCEFWPWGLKKTGGDALSFLEELHAFGLSPRVLDERRGVAELVDRRVLARDLPEREEVFVNLFCFRLSSPPAIPGLAKSLENGVSLCLIVKNEEKNIGDCLKGAESLFDEVVVCDTGSTDRTKEIAQSLGAKVVDFPWVDSFAAARNASLSHATRQWIFWLDADDRLDLANREKLRHLLANLPKGNVAYNMKCCCLGPDGTFDTVVDHIRLFRNDPRIRYRYRIHEQILGAIHDSGGEVREGDVSIAHVGYADPALRKLKTARDLRLLEIEHAEQPLDPFTLFNLGMTYNGEDRHEEALVHLRESLKRSNPRDSIVRKLYSLLVSSLVGLNRRAEAIQTCRDGLAVCPNDAELLFLLAQLHLDEGDAHSTKVLLLQLLASESTPRFASINEGLRGHLSRNLLAQACLRLGERSDAEAQWKLVLRDRPGFLPALRGLAGLSAEAGGHRAELDEVLAALAKAPDGMAEAHWWRTRSLLCTGDLTEAQKRAEEAVARWPNNLSHWLLLADVAIAQRRHPVAEEAYTKALAIAPDNADARRRLEDLRRSVALDRAFPRCHDT